MPALQSMFGAKNGYNIASMTETLRISIAKNAEVQSSTANDKTKKAAAKKKAAAEAVATNRDALATATKQVARGEAIDTSLEPAAGASGSSAPAAGQAAKGPGAASSSAKPSVPTPKTATPGPAGKTVAVALLAAGLAPEVVPGPKSAGSVSGMSTSAASNSTYVSGPDSISSSMSEKPGGPPPYGGGSGAPGGGGGPPGGGGGPPFVPTPLDYSDKLGPNNFTQRLTQKLVIDAVGGPDNVPAIGPAGVDLAGIIGKVRDMNVRMDQGADGRVNKNNAIIVALEDMVRRLRDSKREISESNAAAIADLAAEKDALGARVDELVASGLSEAEKHRDELQALQTQIEQSGMGAEETRIIVEGLNKQLVLAVADVDRAKAGARANAERSAAEITGLQAHIGKTEDSWKRIEADLDTVVWILREFAEYVSRSVDNDIRIHDFTTLLAQQASSATPELFGKIVELLTSPTPNELKTKLNTALVKQGKTAIGTVITIEFKEADTGAFVTDNIYTNYDMVEDGTPVDQERVMSIMTIAVDLMLRGEIEAATTTS